MTWAPIAFFLGEACEGRWPPPSPPAAPLACPGPLVVLGEPSVSPETCWLPVFEPGSLHRGPGGCRDRDHSRQRPECPGPSGGTDSPAHCCRSQSQAEAAAAPAHAVVFAAASSPGQPQFLGCCSAGGEEGQPCWTRAAVRGSRPVSCRAQWPGLLSVQHGGWAHSPPSQPPARPGSLRAGSGLRLLCWGVDVQGLRAALVGRCGPLSPLLMARGEQLPRQQEAEPCSG